MAKPTSIKMSNHAMSKAGLLAALSIAFFAASAANADDAPSPKAFQQVLDFVESNLIGKTLETISTNKLGDGSIETEFDRRMMYTNLVRTDENATFDAIVLIRQKLWDLDSTGKRATDEPRIKNRALVVRFSVYASKATGDAIGSSTILTNSIVPSVGYSGGIQMRLADGKLILVDSTTVYADGFAQGGTYKPYASKNTSTFSVTDGKLTEEYIEQGYDVNPETLERTPSGPEVRLMGTEVPSLF